MPQQINYFAELQQKVLFCFVLKQFLQLLYTKIIFVVILLFFDPPTSIFFVHLQHQKVLHVAQLTQSQKANTKETLFLF